MSLEGMPVLVVEDETIIAMLLEDMVEDLGWSVAGRAARVAEALSMIDSTTCAVAILDVNLAGESIEPVACLLADRGIPFVVSSGYDSGSLPVVLQGRPFIQKPYQIDRLRDAVQAALTGNYGSAG